MKSLLAILLATTMSAAELPLMPDQPVAPVVYVPSAGNDDPRAATNGDTTFAVWRVFDSGLVEGACLRHDGVVSTVPSILIGQDVNPNAGGPFVRWIGGHYLVLWADSQAKIFTRRFASDGRSLEAGPRQTNILYPREVVTDGTNAMVIGSDNSGIAVQRIDADGQPLAAAVHVLSGFLEGAAANSNGVMLVSLDGASETISIGWNGAIRKITPIAGDWVYGSLAEGGGRFLLLGGFRNAQVLDADGAPIGTTLDLGGQTSVIRAAWNGASWCVVRSNGATYQVARITAEGRLEAFVSPAFGGMDVRDVLWNGTSFVAVGGLRTGVSAIAFDRVEASAQSPSRVALSLAAPEESDAVIASTADRSLAVWRVRIDADTLALRGAFITDGLASAPFDIAETMEDEAPAVATDGIGFFVVWRDGMRLNTRAISAQQVLGPVQSLDTFSTHGAAGAAWSGRAWIVVYVDPFIHVAAFTRSGTIAVDPFMVTNSPYVILSSSSVSVACDDADCLLVTRLVEPDPHIGEVPPPMRITLAARVSRDGTQAGPLVTIPLQSAAGWPLAMRTGGASIVISNEDGKSLSAVRLDAPATKTTLVSRASPVSAVSVDRSGLYWSESALLHWSSIDAAPGITSTIDFAGAMSAPVAASSTSTQAHVLLSDGTTDPDLLAARVFIRAYATPDPLAPIAPSRRRVSGRR